MGRGHVRRKVAVGAVALLLGATAVVMAGPDTAGAGGAGDVTETFTFTGGVQQFVVPAGVTEVTIEAFGAQGGDNYLPADAWDFGQGDGSGTPAN